MSAPIPRPGILQKLYWSWKSLKLPWRTQTLIGADLSGNTFWEFQDQLNANRLRRIVRYSAKAHYADIKISPQWHQWLRHTRDFPPTIQEQQYEISRQAMMKQLAAEADERWKSVPSFLDAPRNQAPTAATGITDSKPVDAGQVENLSPVGDAEEVARASEGEVGKEKEKGKGPSPWARADKGGPGEKWEPAAWTPGVARRR